MENKLRVVLFVSRNKDNKHLHNYTQRKKSFLSNKTVEELESKFKSFVKEGLYGEFCRMYVSVNRRDEDKVRKALMHEMLDNEVDLTKLDSKLASLAAKKNCTAEKKWMFDFDSEDNNLLNEFNELDILKFLLKKEELMLNNYKNYNNYLDEIIVKSLEKNNHHLT